MSYKNTNRGADCGWDPNVPQPGYHWQEPGGHWVKTETPLPGSSYGSVNYGNARTFEGDLDAVLGRIKELLMAKNAAYGDAALSPLRFHSSASPVEQLNVRMDDKLSRMARGGKSDEDEPLDYVGYWVLREIAKLREAGINV